MTFPVDVNQMTSFCIKGNTKQTFIYDVLEILKRMFQNLKNVENKCGRTGNYTMIEMRNSLDSYNEIYSFFLLECMHMFNDSLDN